MATDSYINSQTVVGGASGYTYQDNDATRYYFMKIYTTLIDAILSVVLVCSMCGTPVKKKRDLVKVGQYYRCPRCVDEER